MSDILYHILQRIKSNLVLFFIVIGLAVGGSFIHYKLQKINYVSFFETDMGSLEYELFQDLVDFDEIDNKSYALSEDNLTQIREDLGDFNVSYVMRTSETVRFTLVSESDSYDDHLNAMSNCLALMNSNIHITNYFADQNQNNENRISFLNEKMADLDTMWASGSDNGFMATLPAKQYELYSIRLSLEEELSKSGKISLLRSVGSVSEKVRPLIMFVFFYLVIAVFIFFAIGKKPSINQERLGKAES